MLRREESDLKGQTKRQVVISSEVGGPISALVPGPGCQINDAWVEVAGNRVTEVAVGAAFDICVNYRAENAAPGPISAWCVCVTAIGDGIKGYENTKSGLVFTPVIEQSRMVLNKYQGSPRTHIMPAGTAPLSLRIKLWLNDTFDPSPQYPPESTW